MRSDAELYLTFDVSRSMLAAGSPGGVSRLERARALGSDVHAALADVPTGIATLTNRMMPLLFPTGDGRAVSAVIDHSVRLMQPRPERRHRGPRELTGNAGPGGRPQLLQPGLPERVLVVLSDLDTDPFSLNGTLQLLRRHRIEPFVVRVAAPGERIFDPSGRPYAYASVSTVPVAALRRAGWHAFDENEAARLVAEIRSYLGRGPIRAERSH